MSEQLLGRALVRELTAQHRRVPFRRCTYCGQPCYGLTCRSHRDLLTLDANYAEARADAWAS